MKLVLIIGMGKFGYHLCRKLAELGNQILVVDEDEEAVGMVKFQYSYTLASKMVQTLTEVYDQLILRTGV